MIQRAHFLKLQLFDTIHDLHSLRELRTGYVIWRGALASVEIIKVEIVKTEISDA
jgi:hypothetical protein